MDILLVTYQWEIFISLEILSVLSLLTFGLVRYFLDKKKLSFIFLGGFILFLLIEALLAYIIYRQTGQFDTFQIVIIIFLLYAFTFGINDFKKLDRWMRKKIGGFRGKNLLTEKDLQIEADKRNPAKQRKKALLYLLTHSFIFVLGQAALWYIGTGSFAEMLTYLKDLSWFKDGNFEASPYLNEGMFAFGSIWIVAYGIDLVWSGYDILFPKGEKSEQ